MDISIIIVNWNTKELLLDCIESLRRQSEGVSMEVIVVDNASSDGSSEAVRKAYPNVVVIENQANLGFARANNIGIERAAGRYVCLCNSDIEVLGDAVAGIVDYLDRNPQTGAVGPKTLNPDRSLRKNCRRFPTLWNTFCAANFLPRYFPRVSWLNGTLMTDFDHESTRTIDVLPGCFFAVRRTVLDEVGVLDDRYFIYGEDKDWCRRIKNSGYSVVFFPEAEVIHFTKGSSSKAPTRFMVEKIKANYQYWEKFHSRLELALFAFAMRYHYALRFILLRSLMLIRNSKDDDQHRQLNTFRACLFWLSHRVSTPIEVGLRFGGATTG